MIAALALAELRMNARSAGFRVLALLLAAFAALGLVGARYADPLIMRVEPLAEESVRGTGMLLVILAPLLICGAARREHRLGMDELILSKPPSSEALLWGKFLGGLAGLLLLIVPAVLAVVLVQPLLFGGAVTLLPPLVGGLRTALPVLFTAGLAFALAVLLRSAMVAALVIALPIGIEIAKSHLAPAAQYSLTPYHLAYGLLGLALVAAVAGGWERRREPERRLPRSWLAGALLLIAAGGAGAVSAWVWRGGTTKADPALVRLAGWRGDKAGTLPKTPLRTLDGGTLRLSQWQGKPVVLVFWSTGAAGGAVEAAALERAWREAAPERVGFASVCVTDDPGQGWDIARVVGLRAPVIWNPPSAATALGLAGAFSVPDEPRGAVAALIARDGTAARQALAVSQPPPLHRGRPPRRDWERQLVEQGTTAFRQLAAGGR